MEERTTRYDNAIKKDGGKNMNVFEQSNRALKSPKGGNPDGDGKSHTPADTDTSGESGKQEKESGKARAKEGEKAPVSKKLNISDITDAAAKKGKKKGGRSRTFYMQDAMYDKLAAAAEENGIKPSQLLHIILENVLEKM